LFRERLHVPLRWWVIATIGVVIGGAEVFAGFDWHIVVLVYVGLAVPTAAILVATGRLTVRVDTAGLHGAGQTLPGSRITGVRRLDAGATRRALGAEGDRRAHLVARGYVREAVMVRTDGQDEWPYWLVSSRHPDELMAAINMLVTVPH
jgi:hypothetical protein